MCDGWIRCKYWIYSQIKYYIAIRKCPTVVHSLGLREGETDFARNHLVHHSTAAATILVHLCPILVLTFMNHFTTKCAIHSQYRLPLDRYRQQYYTIRGGSACLTD